MFYFRQNIDRKEEPDAAHEPRQIDIQINSQINRQIDRYKGKKKRKKKGKREKGKEKVCKIEKQKAILSLKGLIYLLQG